MVLSIYLVGIIGFAIPFSHDIFVKLTPFTLIASLAFVLFYHQEYHPGFIVKAVLVYIAGFVIEAIGVNTGNIFGEYTYTRALGPQVFNTPLVIGINWLLLIYCISVPLQQTRLCPVIRSLAGASIMVAYDLLLEPVAVEMPMWEWKNDHVPVQNYIAWFIISFLMLLLMTNKKKQIKNNIALFMLIIQFIFMTAMNILFLL
jgi:putative membrane protein